jgi:hypothetical protein
MREAASVKLHKIRLKLELYDSLKLYFPLARFLQSISFIVALTHEVLTLRYAFRIATKKERFAFSLSLSLSHVQLQISVKVPSLSPKYME